MSSTRSGVWKLKEVRNSLADAAYGTVVSAQILLVAGGATGGSNYPNSGYGIGSGGGAGGALYSTAVPLSSGFTHTITIGAGGNATTGYSNNGNNTTITLPEGTFTALGGGKGGGYAGGAASNGGCGGGDGSDNRGQASGYFTSAYGTSTQTSSGYFTAYGNRGGRASTNGSSIIMGGGGGLGGVGLDANSSTNTSGAGGPGITLLGMTVGGGGGCSGYNGNGSAGGSGGGGGDSTAGTANTGGGGGGGGYVATNGAGSGGSGVVVIQYLDSYPPAITTGNPTYTASGGYRKYVFTGSGTIAF